MQTCGPRSSRAAAAVALVLVAGLLGGCGTFAQEYPPTGVDGLTIPTPSPDPADFGGVVDNPWLPLQPGTVLIYRVHLPDEEQPAERTRTVLDGAVPVAGVATTAVHDVLTGPHGAVLSDATAYYAQDRRGNVWWFGLRPAAGGGWLAGEGGAQAGLAMAAHPRQGDGYRPAYLPGVVEDVATVGDVDDDSVEVEIAPGSPSGATTAGAAGNPLVEEEYAAGTGLTRRVDGVTGQVETLQSRVER